VSLISRFRRLAATGRMPAAPSPATDGGPEHPPEDGAESGAGNGTAGRRAGWRAVAARSATVLSALIVLLILVAPSNMDLESLTPAAFLRIPVEALVGAVLLVVVPARARRVAALLGGVGLGLLAIVKMLDIGFLEVLARPFDPVLDWVLVKDAQGFLHDSFGPVGAVAGTVAAVIVVLALLALTTAATLRVTRVLVRHDTVALRGAAALGVVWVTLALLSAQIVPNVPVASRSAGGLVYHRAQQVAADLRDEREFNAQAAVDAFRGTPGQDLLTALRGKDVVVTFVESYGRVAVEDPDLSPQINAVLADGDRQLGAAGFGSRSAFLTSPVLGSGSWLAHATFLSGLKVDNQQRYRTLTSSDRFTLSKAFQRANWQTVAVQPGTNRPWPEGTFYGYDRQYNLQNLGYQGPNFSWSAMPDQYTLSAFQRLESGKPNHAPLMAEIDLTSSHMPWAPLPRTVDWNAVGNGSVYRDMPAQGDQPDAVWKDRDLVRAAYQQSIEYSLNSLFSYVQKYGNDNLVLIFLGDHQPLPIVSGDGASHDVPITIVSKDRSVLDRISGWGWQDGLKPGPQAPVWPMNAFRDRFLTTFGPQGGTAAPAAAGRATH
jgi:hypothetical protein